MHINSKEIVNHCLSLSLSFFLSLYFENKPLNLATRMGSDDDDNDLHDDEDLSDDKEMKSTPDVSVRRFISRET